MHCEPFLYVTDTSSPSCFTPEIQQEQSKYQTYATTFCTEALGAIGALSPLITGPDFRARQNIELREPFYTHTFQRIIKENLGALPT